MGLRNVRKRTEICMKSYNQKMAEIIKMGKPVTDTLVEMLEEAAKYKITQPALRKKCNCNTFGMSHKHNKYCDKVKWVDFSPMRQELYCEHGVGHGYHVHGCCGCCGDPSFAKEFKKWQKKMDKAGIKSQKHILKEWDKNRGLK